MAYRYVHLSQVPNQTFLTLDPTQLYPPKTRPNPWMDSICVQLCSIYLLQSVLNVAARQIYRLKPSDRNITDALIIVSTGSSPMQNVCKIALLSYKVLHGRASRGIWVMLPKTCGPSLRRQGQGLINWSFEDKDFPRGQHCIWDDSFVLPICPMDGHHVQHPSAPIDNVWRTRGKIIRTVLCCIVFHNFTRLYAHSYEQFILHRCKNVFYVFIFFL